MSEILTIYSKIEKGGGAVILASSCVLLVCLYFIIVEPVAPLVIYFIILMLLGFYVRILVKDKVTVNETGEGSIYVSLFKIFHFRKYSYHGLSKAKLIMYEEDIEGTCIKSVMSFDDGYEIELPMNSNIHESLIAWFQEKHNFGPVVIEQKSDRLFQTTITASYRKKTI